MNLTSFSRRFKESATAEDREGIRPVPEPKESFRAFIERVDPTFRFAAFNELIIAELQRGYIEGGWVWINIPPRLGKTKLLRLFSAWILLQDPRCHVGYVSYANDVAAESSKETRDFYEEAGGQLDPAMRLKANWQTRTGGRMWARGPAGSVRSKGFHIGIIDDLHKDSNELLSEAKVNRYRLFIDGTFANRAMAYTHRPILRIYVGQRLSENDVFGYEIDKAADAQDGAKWRCVVLDGVKEDTPVQVPIGATVVKDTREVGESLNPDVVTERYLKDNFADEEAYVTQCQQRPKIRRGAILSPAWFKVCGPQHVPACILSVAGGDLAISTKSEADWTVFVKLTFDGHNYYLHRPYRAKRESPDLRREVPVYLRHAQVSRVGVEAIAFQAAFVQELQHDPTMAGIVIEPVGLGSDRMDKKARARSWSPFAEQGRVWLVEDGTGWTETFLKEVETFTIAHRHDDQVDAVGIAFAMVRSATFTRPATGGKR